MGQTLSSQGVPKINRWTAIAMASLGVNLDHLATVRQARRTVEPDPVTMALLAELGGADGITVHLREDRRHIQDRDVELLKATVRTRLNLEMAATEAMLAKAIEIQPAMVTLVPERREEVTTEGGLDVAGQGEEFRRRIQTLQGHGIPVSLFVDAEPQQLQACKASGAQWVELHTGAYADASWAQQPLALAQLVEGCDRARQLGLRVNAGHGLTYQNVEAVAAIPGIEELNIGHTIVARALAVGLEQAVRQMKQLISQPRREPLFGAGALLQNPANPAEALEPLA
jgi:pyridoxine 5-phosphate synthase